MDYQHSRNSIAQESARICQLAGGVDLDAAVPTCPGWTVSDLLDHVAGVQMWADGSISSLEASVRNPLDRTKKPIERLEKATKGLLKTIDHAKPTDTVAKSDAAPKSMFAAYSLPVSTWVRRQANEAAMHRVDMQFAVGESPQLLPEEAVDLIGEFVEDILPRTILRYPELLPKLRGDVHIHCNDFTGEWTFRWDGTQYSAVAEHRKADVALTGPSSAVALCLFGRVKEPTVQIMGDEELLDRWIDICSF